MAGKKRLGSSLAAQIADLEDPTPIDYDPENLSGQEGTSDEDFSGTENDTSTAARDHYQAVGKSKLRNPEAVTLGKEYAGSRVSRDALDAEDSDDDPFRKTADDEDSDVSEDDSDKMDEDEGNLKEAMEQVDMDEEIDSDEALGESDVERFKDYKFGGSKTTKPQDESDEGSEDDESGSDEEMGDDDIEGDEDGSEESDISEEEEDGVSEDSDENSNADEDISDDRAELRRLMASDHKTVAASISQAVKADAAKGIAIKKQRLAFDALLNTRMKLQKGITAINDLPSADDSSSRDIDQQSVKAAEAAALALWSTLEDLRHALSYAQGKDSSSKKRKRNPLPSASTPSAELWDRTNEMESRAVPHRRAVLDKWSQKTRASRAALPSGRGTLLNTGAANQQSLTTVLDAQVASSTNTNDTYDDSTFYQSLLRDLVEQRMASSNATAISDLQSQLPSSLSLHPTTGMRKDKVKRAVDTKASKGRKMRYTVHEKLQDFMAPEDRGSWGERAREEFFASLLGRDARAVLGEEDEEGENGVDGEAGDEGEDVEEGGLRLFRS